MAEPGFQLRKFGSNCMYSVMIGQGKGLDVELLFGCVLLRRVSWEESAHLIESKQSSRPHKGAEPDHSRSSGAFTASLWCLSYSLHYLCKTNLWTRPSAWTCPITADQHTAPAPSHSHISLSSVTLKIITTGLNGQLKSLISRCVVGHSELYCSSLFPTPPHSLLLPSWCWNVGFGV